MKYFFILTLVLLPSIATSADIKPLLDQEHTLVNKIWDVRQQTFVSQHEVKKALVKAHYVFLGESHDNPIHHELQNWALKALIKQHPSMGVAFEMIDNSQIEKIDWNTIANANALFDAIDWDKSGWPTRTLYHDIFQTVIDAKLPIYSANLPRDSLREVIAKSTAPTPEIQQLLEQRPLTEKESDAMLNELRESHCNMLPERYVSGMITGQRVRDALMASSLLNHQNNSPAVLVAGKAHGRLDRGAPAFIRQQHPNAKMLSIGWHEVQSDKTTPNDYIAIWNSKTLPFDYVWFTPRVDRPAPCDEIKKFLDKKRAKDNADKAEKT